MHCYSGLRILTFFSSSIFILGAVSSNVNNDRERIQTIIKIPARQWNNMLVGNEPWPKEVFPLSRWSDRDKDMTSLPESFHKRLKERELEWPRYLRKLSDYFKTNFNNRIKNLYDLFCLEQQQMKTAAYSETRYPEKSKKTLTRFTDLACLPADNFGAFQGGKITQIRLFSFKQGKLRTIPFDILEATKDGQAVLPQGPEANPEDGDGFFRGKDRLFFMIADAGDQIPNSYIRKIYPDINKTHEITISYPKDKEMGWVYIAHFNGTAPELSPLDYVMFFRDTGTICLPFAFCQVACKKAGNKIVPTGSIRTFITAPGVSGLPIDVHERLFLNTELDMRVKTNRQNEDDFDLSLRSWFDGNVILFSRITFRLDTMMNMSRPYIFIDFIVQAAGANSFITVFTDIDPRLSSVALKYVAVNSGEEYNSRIYSDWDLLNTYYLTSSFRAGAMADGKAADQENKWDNKVMPGWALFTGRMGTTCIRTGFDNFITRYGNPGQTWEDSIENGMKYTNHFRLTEADRTVRFNISWSLVPDFWNENPRKYNWGNLYLILKKEDKLLRYTFEDGHTITPDIYYHKVDAEMMSKIYQY